MDKKIILTMAVVLCLTACKKNYVCECPVFGGNPYTYTIKDTKSKASKKCEDTFTVDGGGCKLK